MNIRNIRFILTTIIMLLLISDFSCKTEKITLRSKNGSRTLVYNCNNFQHQVQSREDIQLLITYVREIGSDLRKSNKYVTLTELQNAYDSQDIKTMERIVVMELCEKARKK